MTKEQNKALMAAFAQFGSTPGTTAHYVFADGGGGVVISETDDATEGFRAIQPYGEWIEYDSKVVLTIDEAVPVILEALG
jgi:hypothetical protein